MLSKLTNPVLLICATVILVSLLAGIFLLAWHGTISGGEAITFAGGVVTFLGGLGGAHASFNAGANAAKNAPPPKVVLLDGGKATQVEGQ